MIPCGICLCLSDWRVHSCCTLCCCSVAKIFSALCDPMGLQHTRILSPSPSPGVCSSSCPLGQWCCLTISFSESPFSSCVQYFPASESFPVSWLFTSGGQSIGASASASVLPIFSVDILYDCLVWSLAVQRTLKSLLQHHSSKASSAFGVLYGLTLRSVQNYWKNHSFTMRTFAGKVMSVLFNMLSRFAIAFLPKSKHLLISWLQSSYEFGQMDNDMYLPRWYHTE